jgi:hypothetical protein
MNVDNIKNIRIESESVDANMVNDFLDLFTFSQFEFAQISTQKKEVIQFNLLVENQTNLETFNMSRESVIFGYFLKLNGPAFSADEFLDYLFINLSEKTQEKFLDFFINSTKNDGQIIQNQIYERITSLHDLAIKKHFMSLLEIRSVHNIPPSDESTLSFMSCLSFKGIEFNFSFKLVYYGWISTDGSLANPAHYLVDGLDKLEKKKLYPISFRFSTCINNTIVEEILRSYQNTREYKLKCVFNNEIDTKIEKFFHQNK